MSLRSREPLIWVAAAFAAGILAETRAWRPDNWWLAAFAAGCGASAYFLRRREWLAVVLAALGVFSLGALEAQLAMAPAAAPQISRWCDGREVTVVGHVRRDGLARPPKFGKERQAVEIETEQIADEAGAQPVQAGLRVTLYGESDGSPLLYGDRVRFHTRLREPRNYGNPGAMDAAAYFRGQGIVAMGAVKTETVERLPGFGGSRLEYWRNRARRGLVAHTVELWGERDAALLDAMLIGQRAYIERDTREDFQRTGTYHILVVSGMNVGILAVVTFWVLRRLRAGEALTTVVAVLTTGLYATLTDAGPPIFRATLMLWLYLGARLLYRERAPLNAVGAAALALLVLDPKALFDPSFQLTFLSVLAIGGIGVPLLERTSQPYKRALRYLDSISYDMTMAPRLAQFRLDARLVAEKLRPLVGRRLAPWMVVHGLALGLSIFDLVCISGLMQVALALPMAAYFHRAAILTMPANSLVVPLATLLMPVAIVAVGVSYVWMGAAKVAVFLAAAILHAITAVVRLLGGWAAAEVRLATPTMAAALLAVFAFAACMVLVRQKRGLALAGVVLLVASAGWITAVPPREQLQPGVLEVTSLDVGQGDSHFLVTPQGRKLLLDAGGAPGTDARTSFDIGEDVVSPYLWSRGITRLDAVALSHAHTDHMGGLASVIANFRPRELWIGSQPANQGMQELLELARSADVRVVLRSEGETFQFGGARFEVLSPPREWDATGKARNDDSLVLHIQYGETAALLEGDVEKRMERRLATLAPRADLLKVAHHGSATSTQPELLAAVQPHYAVISAGARNPWGYPKPEVLERLQQAGVRTYRTDMQGAVTFYLDGKSVQPRPPSRR